MPWRGAEFDGEFPTLGHQVIDLIESVCVIPDGDHQGEPFVLTDEQARFLLHFYRLDPDTGRFVHHRGGQLVRPQKWGKGPFSAAVIIAEAHPDGPVRFDGWDADGEPVGTPWPTPWIQVTAASEDQAANVWRALQPMVEMSVDLKADIPDTGETRINLPGGGRIEPVTASARSRLGQRLTFCLQDETHSWTALNGGRRLADNQRRNLAGMGGRWLETTNAWDPSERSVAQHTHEGNEPGVLLDHVDPGPGSIRNQADRRRMLRRVYGDSLHDPRTGTGWVDLVRIDSEIEALLTRDAAQAERFFLNRIRAAEDSAFDIHQWEACARRGYRPNRGALITIGVDGARTWDALAIVATEVDTGHQWPLGIWERPEAAGDDYEHPRVAIDAAIDDAMGEWSVWRVYIDPQHIDGLVDDWQGRYGAERIIRWYTARARQMAWAVRKYTAALTAGDITNDADPQHATHIANAKRWRTNVKDDEGNPMHVIGKDRRDSPRKMDAAVASVLSWEARGDAIAAGATAQKRSRRLVAW